MTTLKNLLNNRILLTIGVTESISAIGDWITIMAVFVLLIFRGGGGVVQSSGIFLAGIMPTLLSSPLAGWLCDHFDRKHLMITSHLISALVVSGLVFTTRVEVIYALLALEAVSISIMAPARQAVLPGIVSGEELTQANAFLQQLSSMIKIFAPMLAGLVLSVLDPHQAIILDILSFILAAVILTRIPSLPPQNVNRTEDSKNVITLLRKFIKTLSETFRLAPSLRLLFFGVFFTMLVIIEFDTLCSVYVRDILKGDERLLGFLTGLVGLGSLVVTLQMMLNKKKPNHWRDYVIGILLLAAIPLTASLSAYLQNLTLARVMVLIACFVGGIGTGLIFVHSITLLQTLTPSPVLGQLSGMLQSAIVAGQLIGIVLAPILVPATFSIESYLGFSGLALVALAGLIIVQLPHRVISLAETIPETQVK